MVAVSRAEFQESGSAVGIMLAALVCWRLACPLEIEPAGLLRKPVSSFIPLLPPVDWSLRARRRTKRSAFQQLTSHLDSCLISSGSLSSLACCSMVHQSGYLGCNGT